MEITQAIELLKRAVKHTGTIDQKHIDLSVVAAVDRHKYEKALMVVQTAIKAGQITREEFNRRVHLDT